MKRGNEKVLGAIKLMEPNNFMELLSQSRSGYTAPCAYQAEGAFGSLNCVVFYCTLAEEAALTLLWLTVSQVSWKLPDIKVPAGREPDTWQVKGGTALSAT